MEQIKERIKQFWNLPISLKAFYYLLFLTIGESFFIFIRPILNSAGLSGSADNILSIFWIIGIYFCLSLIFKSIRLVDIVGYLAICSFYYLSPTIYPNTRLYVENTFSIFALQTLPFYILALLIDFHRDKTALTIISKLQLVMTALIILLSMRGFINNSLKGDDMGMSYSVLFPAMFLYYTYSETKNKLDLMFFLLGVAMILVFGTRGPFLCLIVFLLVFLFLNYRQNAVMTINLLLVIGAIFIFLRPIMIVLMFLTRMVGLSTRIFESYLEDNLLNYENSSGRNEIHEILWNYIINDRGGIGYGFGSDRIISGFYAHNLVYEVWTDFGLYIGTFLLILFVFFIVKTFRKAYGSDSFNLFLMLLICSVGRLMLSSSYLQDLQFYFLIGFCVNILRSRNIESENNNEEFIYIQQCNTD
jgi:hypothetical protein